MKSAPFSASFWRRQASPVVAYVKCSVRSTTWATIRRLTQVDASAKPVAREAGTRVSWVTPAVDSRRPASP